MYNMLELGFSLSILVEGADLVTNISQLQCNFARAQKEIFIIKGVNLVYTNIHTTITLKDLCNSEVLLYV
jgi:hypothetical protein